VTTEDTVGADGAGGAIVSLDARAVQASVQVVSLIGPADLARPTPCGDWTLDELLTHMTGAPRVAGVTLGTCAMNGRM
jgi:hypothetical protein